MAIFRKKKTIYTACFGNYDIKINSVDKYFDENNNPFNGNTEQLSPRLMAKMYKVLNPFGYEVWIDSSIEIFKRRELLKLLEGDFCLFKHPFNKTLSDELNLCHEIGHVNDNQKQKIIDLYKSAELDIEKTPVYAAGVLYRTPKMGSLNRLWWSLICQYSDRDQLILPYVINQYPGIDIKVLDLDIFNNEYLKVHKHK